MVNCPSDNPPPQPTYNNVNWGQGNTPSTLYYNNIISMGVSYSWENKSDSDGGAVFCTGLNQGKNDFVKKTKTVTLDALNIDLNNAGGSTIAKMGANQDKYVVTDKVSVYANGMYVGKGKLTDYSINEGSMTNDSITNLTYDLSNEDSDSIEDIEDPVQRTESITVSRDLNSKSYKIEHSYGVSFGDDFDLITEYPLYKNNPSYGSVDGRLALGEQEANLAIYDNPIDYGEYIDLSAYATQEGWSFNVLENGCSGVFSSSSETKDFINGDYSLSKTTELRYTGEDISTGQDFYEITYTMDWSEDTRNNSEEPCAVVKMQGKIRGIAKNCSQEFNASVFAKSGYDDFVVGGKAKEKVSGFFNYIQENINGVPTGELNDTMFDLKKDECNPSVDRGEAKNDGEIDFSFEMHNCPNYDIENGSSVTNSFDHSKNISECNGAPINVTTYSSDISVQAGECFLAIDENGNFPKFESIGNIDINKAKDQASDYPSDGKFQARWKIKSESFTESPYKGSKGYSVSFSDSPSSDECGPRNLGCDKFNTKIKETPSRPRYIDTETPIGIVSEIQGKTLKRKSVSTAYIHPKTGCDPEVLSIKGMMNDKILGELQDNKPSCIIDSLNWSYSAQFGSQAKGSANMEGID